MEEFNPLTKRWKKGLKRVALIYPNKYIAGISNLGIQQIYAEINSLNDFICERFYLDVNNGLRSVESSSHLRNFDIALFSIQYEEDYFNVIKILRESNFKGLKVAGGPCVMENPLPLKKFFDILFVGEADGIIENIIKGEQNEGIFKGEKVNRVYPIELDFHLEKQIISEGVYGRALLLEIGRGCYRGCKFCLVRQIYSPVRWRSYKLLLEIAERNAELVDKVALISPSPSDHPEFEKIVFSLYEMGYLISPSSLRADRLNEELIKIFAESGLRRITVAPEVGSEKLMEMIGKGINKEDIMSVAEMSKEYGLSLKLYFMIGFPGENYEDLMSIVEMVKDIRRLGVRVSVSINPLVPKPHTPLQWLPYGGNAEKSVNENIKELKEKVKFLKSNLYKICEAKIESVERFAIQTVLARGGEDVSKLLLGKGKFREIFEFDLQKYLDSFEIDSELPWDVLEIGYSKKRLKKEYEKVLSIAEK